MFKVFILIIIRLGYCDAFGQNDNFKKNTETAIFQVEGVTSYFECETLSVFFNTTQKLKIPVPGIPPRPISERDVSFVIYSRLHVEPLVADTFDFTKLVDKLPINFKLPSVIYVHGLHRTYTQFVPHIKNALFSKENINLIFMDWDSYSDYNTTYSRGNTVPRLGHILAKFLHQFIEAGANPKDIFLMGESSGAQPLGIAGQQIYPKIGKILGIDPVGPCYNFAPDSLRLSQGDADFVQIVHCSIGEFGELSEIQGDVTFYMNGGKIQPQCVNNKNLTGVNKCSHDACTTYLFQTYSNFNKYVGVKCDNYEKYLRRDCDCNDKAVVGYNASTKARGKYYVDTESGSPSICSLQ